MKKLTPFLALFPIFIVACGGAKGPEGKWTGKISLDDSKLSAAEKVGAKELGKQFESAILNVEIRADKTADLVMSAGGKTSNNPTTWTIKDKNLIMTPKNGSVMTFVFSADGNTMTGSDGKMPIIFTLTRDKS